MAALSENKDVLQELHRQLQKSFTVIQHSLKSWKDSLGKCSSEIKSLENLGEQYFCCQEASSHQSPVFNDFPDVKEKLLYKITTEVNNKLDGIQNEIKTLKQICDRISKQCNYSMGVYQKHAEVIEVKDTTEKTPTCPSVAEMLEWVNDTERLFLQQYHIKKFLLDNLNMGDKSTLEQLMSMWNSGEKDMYNQVEEHLCYVSFFIEEKF